MKWETLALGSNADQYVNGEDAQIAYWKVLTEDQLLDEPEIQKSSFRRWMESFSRIAALVRENRIDMGGDTFSFLANIIN